MQSMQHVIVCFLFFGLLACGEQQPVSNAAPPAAPQEYALEDFADVLQVNNLPQQAEDWSAYAFFDHGAWFGFALPDTADKSHQGVFPGPFVATHGRWLGADLLRVTLRDGDGTILSLENAERITQAYYPGRLVQSYRLPNVEIELTLFFTGSRIAAIQTELHNLSEQAQALQLQWSGQPLPQDKLELKRSIEGNTVSWAFGEGMRLGLHSTHARAVAVGDTGYTLEMPPVQLAQGARQAQYMWVTLQMDARDGHTIDHLQKALSDRLPHLLAANNARWMGYINSILNVDSPWAQEPAYRRIAVKALLTLVNNWKTAYRDLHYDGLFPSYAVRYFDGFWSWDSWKHAVALARFDTEIAKNQIRTMFAYQDARGMIADVVYADQRENNWRDTKPPLAAWAVWEIYQHSNDQRFVEEMLPKLMRYHEWWYRDRDHDANGLCEYGSTDGTLEAALWESGMDDAVRYDDRRMLKNNEGAWSLDLESVDLNAYLYAEKHYLAQLAEVMADEALAAALRKQAETLQQQVQNRMFSENSGFFHDINLEDKSIHNSFGPEGWIPLWAELATPAQAARVKDVIMHAEKFNTHVPLPTVSKDNPRFMSGYWRGPVWLDQFYFGIKGLKNYGFENEARQLTRALFDRAEGLKDSPAPIRENYDPRDGKGLKVNHFSWSAAHLLLLYRWE